MEIKIPCDSCQHRDICKLESDLIKAVHESNAVYRAAPLECKKLSDAIRIEVCCKHYSSIPSIRANNLIGNAINC